jgi:ribosomal protein L11 methyltransferase
MADLIGADLWEMGTAGLVEETSGLRAFFEDSVERSEVCARFALTSDAARNEPPFDYQHVPQEYDPVLIGERFYVAPSSVKSPPPPGRFRLTIDTSSAFGSGRHESTQLCVEVLEKHLKTGNVVLDIGCGSGILSAAASLLGAGAVFACDIHQDSVRTARTLIDTPIFVGSADGIKAHQADLVFANISAKVVDLIAADLQRIAKPMGLIVISGFTRGNPPARFRPREVWEKGDWQCWVCGPADIEISNEPSEPVTHTQQWWL